MNKKNIIIFLMIFLSIISASQNYVNANSLKENYISVKLSRPIKDKHSINLYSEEGFALYYKENLSREVEMFDIKYLNISLDSNRFVISDSYNNYLSDFGIDEGIVIGSNNGYDSKIKVEDSSYRGYIDLKANGSEIIVINYLNLDDYLYGVIPREMPASFHMEALKAQAIGARTYVLYNINKHSGEGYNICDTTHCQVYGGMDGEHERTNKAVDETKGIVITYNGNIIDAVYHSNSGGYTEDSKEAWGGYVPYLTGVEDKYSIGFSGSQWQFTMKAEEISKRMMNSGTNVGNILDMDIIERSPNGRVSKLRIIGEFGEEVLNKSQIRQVLGTNELKSTWFDIERGGEATYKEIYAIDGNYSTPKTINMDSSYIVDENFNTRLLKPKELNIIDKYKTSTITSIDKYPNGNFIIRGKGYGHGVGMSQWGAHGMANEGYTFEEILKHYYTDAEIRKTY